MIFLVMVFSPDKSPRFIYLLILMNTTAPKTRPGIGQLLKSAVSSYVFIGALAFFLIDGSLKIATSINPHVWPMNPMQTAYRSWVWWAVRLEFTEDKQPPDIALLGSSLMMASLSRRRCSPAKRTTAKLGLSSQKRIVGALAQSTL